MHLLILEWICTCQGIFITTRELKEYAGTRSLKIYKLLPQNKAGLKNKMIKNLK